MASADGSLSLSITPIASSCVGAPADASAYSFQGDGLVLAVLVGRRPDGPGRHGELVDVGEGLFRERRVEVVDAQIRLDHDREVGHGTVTGPRRPQVQADRGRLGRVLGNRAVGAGQREPVPLLLIVADGEDRVGGRRPAARGGPAGDRRREPEFSRPPRRRRAGGRTRASRCTAPRSAPTPVTRSASGRRLAASPNTWPSPYSVLNLRHPCPLYQRGGGGRFLAP